MRLVAVGDRLTVDALRLIGIPGTVAETPEEASRAVDEACEGEAVVLVSRSVAQMIDKKIADLKVARRDFMVLELPSGEGPPTQAEETAKLLSQAIGIKL
jgi:vacuolar-type H+-ATPase subunit F/Vma7